MAGVAKLIRRHLPTVLTYLRRGVTNAGLEAVNAVIQWVKNSGSKRPPSTFTVEGSICTHTKAGRAATQDLPP